MEREFLKFFLRSGPCRKYDINYFTHNVRKNSESKLFSIDFLNDAILFKYALAAEARQAETSRVISTLVYLPYNPKQPDDGGEAFVFSEYNFARVCAYKREAIDLRETGVQQDCDKLAVLDQTPTFSPYLVEMSFERNAIQVPQPYLQLTPDVREKMSAHLKSRLRPLIVAAYKSAPAHVEKAVEELTTKLFCMRELRDILPLIEALHLPIEGAQQLLTSWLGIAYFEFEYSNIQHKLHDFAGWMTKYSLPREMLSKLDKDYFKANADNLKKRLRTSWKDIVDISSEYRASYDEFIMRGTIDRFIAFLADAETKYWKMGDILGRFEQTLVVWHTYRRRFPEQCLPYASLIELFGILRQLHRPIEVEPQLGRLATGASGLDFLM